MRYYVELLGHTKNDPQFSIYVIADSVEQVKSLFSEYVIICIDQTD